MTDRLCSCGLNEPASPPLAFAQAPDCRCPARIPMPRPCFELNPHQPRQDLSWAASRVALASTFLLSRINRRRPARCPLFCRSRIFFGSARNPHPPSPLSSPDSDLLPPRSRYPEHGPGRANLPPPGGASGLNFVWGISISNNPPLSLLRLRNRNHVTGFYSHRTLARCAAQGRVQETEHEEVYDDAGSVWRTCPFGLQYPSRRCRGRGIDH